MSPWLNSAQSDFVSSPGGHNRVTKPPTITVDNISSTQQALSVNPRMEMQVFCLSHPNNRIHILKGDGHTIDQVALLKQEVKYSLGVKVPNRVPTYPICLVYPSLCVLSGYVGYNFQHATEFCPEKPPGQQQSHWRSEKSRKLHSVLGRLPSPTACLGSSRLHIAAPERSILALFR